MEPIELNNQNNPDYEAQLRYLIKREFYVTYYRFRKFPYYLIGSTLLIVGLLQFTSSDNLIVLKSMSIVFLILTWAFTLLYLLIILFKWVKRYSWKKKSVALANKESAVYRLYFDETKMVFEASTYKTELTWDYYTWWSEDKHSIFIFPNSSVYNAICYSVNDLGSENYILLKNIVSGKLIKLKE